MQTPLLYQASTGSNGAENKSVLQTSDNYRQGQFILVWNTSNMSTGSIMYFLLAVSVRKCEEIIQSKLGQTCKD